MVQIRENWTDLEGEIVDVRPSPRRPGFVDVEVRVDAAAPVESFADFLGDRVGQALVVQFRERCLEGRSLGRGRRLCVRARRGQGTDDVFAHSESFTIEPA